VDKLVERMKIKCASCGKKMKEENISLNNFFKIPVRTCGIWQAVELGRRVVLICDNCIKEKGIPAEIYMDHLIFK